MNIYLVRHGECVYNQHLALNGTKNTKLTAKGEQQARICAQKLKDAHIDAVYSSPLRRAFSTARIIVSELGLPAEIMAEDRLIERDFGVLTGKLVKEIPLFAKDIIKGDRVDYFLDTEGAESYDAIYERAEDVLRKVLDFHANDNVLLVAHGAVGQIIRAAYYGWPWRESLQKMPYFDNTDIIKLNGTKLKL